ncbi:MAG: transposase [Chloroflexi bacterium]|nr:transposase [Chloroflexota bacterium]
MSSDFATADTLVIALDIGKNVHWLGCYDGPLNVLVEPHKLRSHLDGFRQMTATVDPLLTGGRFRQAILGHEFTGVYHEPWAWQIHEHFAPYLSSQATCPLTYHQLNPLLTKKRSEDHSIRHRSTDRLAVWAVAACLADGLGHPAHRLSSIEAQLGQSVRTLYQLQAQQHHLARQLYPQVDRLWPGAIVNVKRFCAAHPELEPPTPIVRTQSLDRQRVAALLLHTPNPYDALALGPDGLLSLLRREVGRAGPKTVHTILSMLRQAPLPPPAIAAIYAQRLQDDFQAYLHLGDRIATLVTQIETLALHSDARFLDSIPGVSPLLAARYLAAIITVSRFPSAAHIWAFAGYDLVTDESGDTKRLGKITKRGAPTFRDTLYHIGYHTARHCPPIGQTYLNARQRGLDHTLAVIHSAHKANRLCFALLRDQRPYHPVSPDQQARFHRRWKSFHKMGRRRRPQRIAA